MDKGLSRPFLLILWVLLQKKARADALDSLVPFNILRNATLSRPFGLLRGVEMRYFSLPGGDAASLADFLSAFFALRSIDRCPSS